MHAKRIFISMLILTLALSLVPGSQPTRAAPRVDTSPAIETEAPTGNGDASQAVNLPEGVSADWWAQAQAYIQQSEYEITWQEPTYLPDIPAAYQAPNRAQGLRTYFTTQGIRLISRKETAPTWQLGLALAGYGSQAGLQPVGEAALSPTANRMDYQRGELAEWYVNTEAGLEQGFTVGAGLRPAPTIPTTIDLALHGDLTPTLAEDGMAVEFSAPDGSLVLRYGDLQALDAAGQALPVELALLSDNAAGEVTLRLTLPPSSQPVTITARLTSPLGAENAPEGLPTTHDWTYKGAQGGAQTGFSVGTAGDVNGDGYSDIIVGAWLYDNGHSDEGRVLVWYGSADGLCPVGQTTCDPNWTAESNRAATGLGYSVGTAGDVNGDGYDDIIVGARNYDHPETDEGGVFVWYGSATGLIPNGTPANTDWQAESNQVSAYFGYSVGTAGDVNGDGYDDILVGAPYYDNGETDEGGVFVWYGSSNGLCAGSTPCTVNLNSAGWKYESNQASAVVGFSVGTAGDVNGDGYSDVIVGAPLFDGPQGNDQGKFFIWHGSSGGLGISQRDPDWSDIGGWGGHWFGFSVGTAGDVNGDGYDDILVGAPYYNYGEANEGAVYVYYGGGSGVQAGYWRYESNQVGAEVGFSVGTAGDVNGDGYADILAGALYYDGGQTDEGAVYLWYGSTGGMGVQQRPPDWKVEINHVYDYFGYSVGTAGDVNGDGYDDILVGAPGTDDGGTYDVGQVYVYYGSPGNPPIFAGGVQPSIQGGEQIGYSVGTAGDVNGDGYSDIIVGAPYFDDNGADCGEALVWYGSADGLCPADQEGCLPDWKTTGEHAGDYFGFSVGTAGDVNGDGFDDIIVGARLYESESGQLNEGAVYVWHGSADGLYTSYAWKAESNRYGTDFGYSVGTAGDVNGDGYDDILVGAPYYDNGQTDEGGVFVWYGSATGLGENGTLDNVDWRYESNQASSMFGSSVGTAGDVNGDGYSDIIVGAYLFDEPGFGDRGKVFVWYGSAAPDGLGVDNRDPDWSFVGDYATDWFGYSVSTAGDVNGDGYSDIVIGVRYYHVAQYWEGAVYVFYGGESGIQADYWKYESNQASTDLGASVGAAGDVNGDGYADILAGAPNYDGGQTDEGAIYIWYGSSTGLGITHWRYESDQTSALFGSSVGTAGDVNGDGYSDILIGAPNFDTAGYTDAGYVFVFHGSAQGLSAVARDSLEGKQGNAQLGFSVGGAGDVNGDGYGDVIIGIPYFDNGQASEGRVHVYLGSPTGIVTGTVWIAESNLANAHFGSAVGSAGDVNGDGYGDILVGAPGYANGQAEEGAAFVWYGSIYGLGSSGDPTTAAWKAEGDQAQAYFGNAVASAGDVNGDGYGDVIVGADGYDNGQSNEGRAFVYHGSATGLSLSPAWTAESDQAGAAFGTSVGSAGDVTGDGYSDVIVGSDKFDNGELDEGRAYVYYGAKSGLSGSPAWTAESSQTQAFFGYAVNTAGDVNGDGYSDVIVGAYQFQNGDTWRDDNEGAAFVWLGSSAGLGADGDPNNAGWVADGNQKGAQFGYSVSTAGDVNGDGYSDVIVGAPAYNNGPAYEGGAFIYYGSAAGLSATARWTAEGDQEGAAFGSSAAAAGDVNGDGFADVIVGAPNYDHVELANTVEDVGLARVYFGNGKSVLSLRPRQMRVGAAIPIAPLGLSDSQTSVELRLTGRMPLGRETVKLEWQVAPLGTPFTATGVITGTSATWIDTGDPLLPRVEIAALVTGLAPGTPYHWRVRLVYSGNRLGLGASRWISIPWNGWQELDFRTASPPEEFLRLYLPTVVK
jgi:hypothetical protein